MSHAYSASEPEDSAAEGVDADAYGRDAQDHSVAEDGAIYGQPADGYEQIPYEVPPDDDQAYATGEQGEGSEIPGGFETMDSELPPGARLGNYTIEEKLAEGGMGKVFRAFDEQLERRVAIKVMHNDYASDPVHQSQFLEEARAVAALRHTNIVPLYSVGQEAHLSYFAMAFIEGMTLDDWLTQKGPLDAQWAMWFMTQAVAALQYAARQKIIHLDIKPSNFMVDADNIIMLTDFGLARRRKDTPDGETRELFGTPLYCSPEHILQHEPDVRTDIYSLGATLFHLMTNKIVYERDTLEKMCLAHLHDPFPAQVALDSGVPFGWVCLMQRMMEKTPQFRFQDYDELATALSDVENYRYGKNVICLPPVKRNRALPRYPRPPEDLFGLLPQQLADANQLTYEIEQTSTGDEVVGLLSNRSQLLNLNEWIPSIDELCQRTEGDLLDIVRSMEALPVLDTTISELAAFMSRAAKDPAAKVELLGLERAHAVCITTLMMQKRWHASRFLDWQGLIQHSFCCGIISEMMFDMLGLPNAGMAFTCGLTHDVGKLVLAELFPSSYPGVILKSLRYDIPLGEVEFETFGIEHAQVGELWLRQRKADRSLAIVVGCHDTPDEAVGQERAVRRASLITSAASVLGRGSKMDVELLAHATCSANHLVKELGLGFSGNTYMEQVAWAEHPSTLFVWEARENPDVESSDFISFFTETCRGLPEFSITGLAVPSDPNMEG